tara:strand:+ start:102 stop:884 length:783 start_codon:yes stop_codon:yes gene_type:complete
MQNITEIYEGLEFKAGKLTGYLPVYEEIFSDFRDKEFTFVEVGVMGGGSLEMWRKYFGPKARIIGIDFNPNALKMKEHGFEIFIGDQSDVAFWKKFYEEVGPIDLLLDDGGHTNKQQIVTVESSIQNIKDGGSILIEDVGASFIRSFGNPSAHSFLNYAKFKINRLYARNSALGLEAENKFTDNIFSVNFYDSMVAFKVKKSSCHSSLVKNTGYRDIEAEDYRFSDKILFNSENLILKFFDKLYRNLSTVLENRSLKKYF